MVRAESRVNVITINLRNALKYQAEYRPTRFDEEILKRLFDLNQERARAQGAAASRKKRDAGD
ncbi:MAG TPA: hypothetical protein VFL49_06610 [Pseudolabrys sp.]|nr:hypothetical protein [Pseudolabrys sp.]